MSTEYLPDGAIRHCINFRGETIELHRCPDGLWRDFEGNIFAYAEAGSSRDKEVRCGVGIFSLSKDHPLTPACARHDYAYSSPAYQAFNTREDADRQLRRDIKYIGKGKWYGLLAQPFKTIVDIFGSQFWDNKNTR